LLRSALIILALLSLFGGLIPLDLTLVFPTELPASIPEILEPSWLHTLAILTPFIGILFSWFYFKKYRTSRVVGSEYNLSASESRLVVFCRQGLGFDTLYSLLFIKPYQWLAEKNKHDVVDQVIMLNAWYISLWHDALIMMQNGSLRWYLAAFGLAIMLLLGVSFL
jgi:NADH-quinone oxidoreductase subunit L